MQQFGTAAILCGGKSRRMGFDKCRIRIGDRLLLQILGERLLTVFERVILIVDEAEKFSDLPFCVYPDIFPGTGPLGAIYTALQASSSTHVFITACDMPHIHTPLIQEMKKTILEESIAGVACRKAGYVEPLYAFYAKSMMPSMENLIREGRYKILDAILENPMHIMEEEEWRAWSETDLFLNLNAREDLRLLEELFEEPIIIEENKRGIK